MKLSNGCAGNYRHALAPKGANNALLTTEVSEYCEMLVFKFSKRKWSFCWDSWSASAGACSLVYDPTGSKERKEECFATKHSTSLFVAPARERPYTQIKQRKNLGQLENSWNLWLVSERELHSDVERDNRIFPKQNANENANRTWQSSHRREHAFSKIETLKTSEVA